MSVAVVTGASSGLGRVIARALLGAGWQVALAGRRSELLTEIAKGAPDGAALVVPADVTSPPSVAALFDAVQDHWGRLDLLVNNAGLFGPAAQADEIDLSDWQRVVDTNLTGVFVCAQHAVRMMKAQDPQGGRIINNGSIPAHTPRPNSIAYTATKHAVTGLTKSLSRSEEHTSELQSRENLVCRLLLEKKKKKKKNLIHHNKKKQKTQK